MFTGRQFDIETGPPNEWRVNLYYYRARYYNPHIGRFMQTDPVGYEAGMNLYLYCKNNPLMMVDPLGTMFATYDNSYDPCSAPSPYEPGESMPNPNTDPRYPDTSEEDWWENADWENMDDIYWHDYYCEELRRQKNVPFLLRIVNCMAPDAPPMGVAQAAACIVVTVGAYAINPFLGKAALEACIGAFGVKVMADVIVCYAEAESEQQSQNRVYDKYCE